MFQLCTVHWILLILFLIALVNISNCWETLVISTSHQKVEQNRNVLVFDANQRHAEVRLAVMQTLMSVPTGNIRITVPRRQFKEGLILNEIVRDANQSHHFSNHGWKYHRRLNKFAENSGPETVAILTTCHNSATAFHRSFKQKLKVYKLFCFYHRTSTFGNVTKRQLSKRMKRYNYTFLALSHHVTKGFQNFRTTKIKIPSETYTFVPVFKYTRLEIFRQNWLEPTVVVQGGMWHTTRNYKDLFRAVKKYRHVLRHLKIQLVGVNRAHLKVPRGLSDYIEIHSNLPYPKYYDLISRAIAIFPAFPPKYLRNRASSTIPVSLITCVPVVANKKILNAYNYLDSSVVWYRNSNETEMETLIRYMKLEDFAEVFQNKRQMLHRLRESLIKQNADLLENIMLKN